MDSRFRGSDPSFGFLQEHQLSQQSGVQIIQDRSQLNDQGKQNH
jgi:hypothetical protein